MSKWFHSTGILQESPVRRHKKQLDQRWRSVL